MPDHARGAATAPITFSRSRRRLLVRCAGAAVGLAASRQRPAAAQTGAETDIELLNFLLSVEHLEVALLQQGLAAFRPADWRAAGIGQEAQLDLEEVRDQDQTHAAALADAIASAGGTPIEPVAYVFGYEDSLSFLRVAAGVAQTVVGAYAGAIPSLADASNLPTIVGIHSVEGRHDAFFKLNSALSPFPDPIDRPLTRDDVLANFAGYTGGEAPVGSEPDGASIEPVVDARNVFAAVIADAAERLGIAEEQIDIVEATERQWPTSALGCPDRGMVYAEVVTPGYLVILDAAGTTLEYHTDQGDAFVLCE